MGIQAFHGIHCQEMKGFVPTASVDTSLFLVSAPIASVDTSVFSVTVPAVSLTDNLCGD